MNPMTMNPNVVYTNTTSHPQTYYLKMTTTSHTNWIGDPSPTTSPPPTFITVDPADPGPNFTPDEDHIFKPRIYKAIRPPHVEPCEHGRFDRMGCGDCVEAVLEQVRKGPFPLDPAVPIRIVPQSQETKVPDTCPAAVIRKGKPAVCGKKDCMEHT